MILSEFILVAAALGSGLMAGLFFVFSNTVMSALGRLEPRSGIAAMQSVNRVILNPLFLLTFIGTAGLAVAAGASALTSSGKSRSAVVLGGALLYVVGTFFVTALANVPMNKALENLDPESTESLRYWSLYRSRWTKWNHVRAAASLAASACFILGS